MRPIAIIGAGIAGLSCAVRLREAGVPVEVIEKSRSPGGRAGTCGGDGWQCDHGAQYFTARDPDFVAEVERWLAAGVVATWTPRLAVFDGTRMHPRISGEKRFVARPGMSTLGRHLAAGLSLRENTRVTALAHDVEDWLLDTEEHGRLEPYSGVVVTVPAPQAAAMLASVASELAQVAADAPMHGCWALIARFDNDPQLDFDAAFVNHGALSWVARDSSKPGRPPGHLRRAGRAIARRLGPSSLAFCPQPGRAGHRSTMGPRRTHRAGRRLADGRTHRGRLAVRAQARRAHSRGVNGKRTLAGPSSVLQRVKNSLCVPPQRGSRLSPMMYSSTARAA